VRQTERLYGLALATALAVSRVARRTGELSIASASGELFTAALLHDLGLFALFSFEPHLASRCLAEARVHQVSVCDAERSGFGQAHDELGALLLSRWQLGDLETAACRWHHDLRGAPERARRVAALVHVAEYFVLAEAKDEDFSVLAAELQPEAVDILDLSEADLGALAVEIKPCVEHSASISAGLSLHGRR
jgi:HD-like signal output (HDOD) protein